MNIMWLVVSKRVLIIAAVGCLIIVALGIFLMNQLLFVNNGARARGYLALIIDDFGNHAAGTEAMINLGIPLTAAVMPFLPYSQSDADLAHSSGLEVIMHVPMEPVRGKSSWLGPMAITCGLGDQEIESRLLKGLKQLKWAVGMNNHMGSKTMQDSRIVKIVLEVARKHNLFFVDSRTTENTAALKLAEMLDYPCLERDEFLDGARACGKQPGHIKKQLKKLGEIALSKGYAIGIGHVGAEGGTITARAIKEMYPELEKKGICFVYVSQIREVVSYCKKM
jgi:polysaccharide deacetylase 2 family uncharacterized protein YibQ